MSAPVLLTTIVERRRRPRTRVSRNAYLADIKRQFFHQCFIRDASKAGCRIYAPDALDFPDHVWLFPQDMAMPMLGRVVWRQEHMAGVSLIADPLSVEGVQKADLEPSSVPTFESIREQIALREKVLREKRSREPAAPSSSRLAQVGAYIATVVHELRTPITAISGALSLVLGSARALLPSRLLDMVAVAMRNAERMQLLVSNLLNAEKLKAGKIEIVPVPEDLNALVRDVVALNASYAEVHKVTLRAELLVGRAIARVDRRWMEQVLTNLLSNAAKFSRPGQVVVVRVERAGKSIRLSVIDRGMGIAPDKQARIFEAYEQAGTDAASARLGTGLGLSLCKAIVARHGSRIQLKSEPGKGSVFWFDLAEVDSSPRPRA